MSQKGFVSTVENPGSSKLMLWIKQHLDYPHEDWCLIWPFTRMPQGYATIGRQRKLIYVHRYICELINGPPLEPRYQAAHSCGRGQDGCVNPRHLSWKTPTENQLDRYRVSGLTPRAKLTIEQVDEIRALQGRQHVADVARRFGVAEVNIRRIWAGKIWRKNDRQIRFFTASEVIAIRAQKGTKKASAIAQEYNANRNQIEKILRGATYKWVDASNGHDTTFKDAE